MSPKSTRNSNLAGMEHLPTLNPQLAPCTINLSTKFASVGIYAHSCFWLIGELLASIFALCSFLLMCQINLLLDNKIFLIPLFGVGIYFSRAISIYILRLQGVSMWYLILALQKLSSLLLNFYETRSTSHHLIARKMCCGHYCKLECSFSRNDHH